MVGSPNSVLTSALDVPAPSIQTKPMTRTASLHALPGARALRTPPSLPSLPSLHDAARRVGDATLAPSRSISVSSSVPSLLRSRPSKLQPITESLMAKSHIAIANAAASSPSSPTTRYTRRRWPVDSIAPAASPSPTTKTRRRFAATKQALDVVSARVKSRDLEDMLDASIGVSHSNRQPLEMIKECLRDNVERVVDLFHTLDKDSSGSIDVAEFETGVLAICGDAVDPMHVQMLFAEFDRNGDGEITYHEMHRVLKAKIPYKQELLAMTEPLPAWPELPLKLRKWREEILQLHRMHRQLKVSDGVRRRQRQAEANAAHVERQYVTPADGAHEKLLRRAAGLTLAELLRLYLPPSARVSGMDCAQMASWAHTVDEVKAAHQHLRSLEDDAVMIEALDKDGNGTISKQEFLQLSKLIGLDRAECRLRFREADVAHSGELSIPMTGAVLQTLKKEGRMRQLEEEEGGEIGPFARRGIRSR